MLYKSKSNRNSSSNNEISLQHLYNLNNFFQNQQNNTKYVSKEIKNQIYLARKNTEIIDKTFHQINNHGETLIRKYEEEKQKHEKLEFLVNHYEEEIYKAKLDKSLEQKKNIETDKLVQFTNEIEEKEKNIQKTIEKINNSTYELQKKIDSIRALRSQRTIFSTLFDKIQRQLCNVEHCYKVLVIERAIQEHKYKQSLQEFSKCENQAKKAITLTSRQEYESPRNRLKNMAKINLEHEIYERDQSFAKKSYPTSNYKIDTQNQLFKEKAKEKRSKYESDLIKLQRERKIKTILNDFELSSFKQLPEDVQNLNAQNQRKLQQTVQLSEEIMILEEKIVNLKKNKSNNPKKMLKRASQTLKKQKLNETTQGIQTVRAQLRQFNNICKIVYQRIKETQGQDDHIEQEFINEEQEIVFYMGFFQDFFKNQYSKGPHHVHSKVVNEKSSLKRLTSLLNSHHFERNHMSIYQQKDLLQFAKKNLEKLQKSNFKPQK